MRKPNVRGRLNADKGGGDQNWQKSELLLICFLKIRSSISFVEFMILIVIDKYGNLDIMRFKCKIISTDIVMQ